MKQNARQIVMYYQMYLTYISDNGLDNDAKSLTVGALVDFIEAMDEEAQTDLRESVINPIF